MSSEEETKDDDFDYYQSVYNQRRITTTPKEDVDEDLALVEEFMVEEEKDKIRKQKEIEKDTTKDLAKARDELADLEAMITGELYAPIPEPTPTKEKASKDNTNNKKPHKKRSSDHHKVKEEEIQKEKPPKGNAEVYKHQPLDSAESEEGFATLVGKVRNSTANEEIRAYIAAARDSNKAELAAEKLESARIHDLLENARNTAKGKRSERRLSVTSEPSVETNHFGVDHK